MTELSPFRQVLDEMDRQILNLIKASEGQNKEEVLKIAEIYIKLRANMIEPYRRAPLSPIERSQL